MVKGLHEGSGFRSRCLISRRALKLFEQCRKANWATRSIFFTTCMSACTPNQAVLFAKEAEKYHLFFMEDPLSPEDIAYFRQIRQQCATPIAMGELFTASA